MIQVLPGVGPVTAARLLERIIEATDPPFDACMKCSPGTSSRHPSYLDCIIATRAGFQETQVVVAIPILSGTGPLVERFPMLDQSSVESVTHVIQVALTPVFLLTAVAALLNVFSTRLGRVADRVDQLSANLQRPMPTTTEFSSVQLDRLRRRSLVLDVAVVLATIAGVATSGAALILFVGALREAVVRSMLFVLFGGAIFFTIAALVTFAIEMIMAGRGLRAFVRNRQRTGEKGDSDRS